MQEIKAPRTSSKRRNKRDGTVLDTFSNKPNTSGIQGGKYKPLDNAALAKIDQAAQRILSEIGMSEVPTDVEELLITNGAQKSSGGRILFPKKLISNALANIKRKFTLHGRASDQDMIFAGHKVYVGTGGASPMILDSKSGLNRPSTIVDLFQSAQLVDMLDNIHFFSRPFIAGDIEDLFELDVNTAFACLSGTTKPIFTSATLPESVLAIAEMCHLIAGSEQAFIERPFLSLNINHVVCPLRFSAEACAVLKAAAELNIPFHVNTFGQVGASEPVTLSGTLAQVTAETLAGMIYGWCVNPNARMTFGARPMITDLRTGALTGGGGEQATLMAAAIQMAKFYNLPDTCIAGATDSKLPDAQSGFEKSLAITLSAQAGSNAITQAAGTQASLMSASLESYVIDNDMLGAIMRSVSPIEVTDELLNIANIAEVVTGDGHYLGQSETFARMRSDFLYPEIANRQPIEQWEKEGKNDIFSVAKIRVQELLTKAKPSHLPESIEQKIRSEFQIYLDRYEDA